MPRHARINQRTRTAYHEAGHAVIAHLHKRPFGRVSIVEDEQSLGRIEGGKWRGIFTPASCSHHATSVG
jgi:hypothetical protein